MPNQTQNLEYVKPRKGSSLPPVFDRVKASELVYALIQTFKTVFLMQNAVCKFEPSCSVYAKESIRTLPLHRAAIKIIRRILRCNPFSRGGYDPVTIERH